MLRVMGVVGLLALAVGGYIAGVPLVQSVLVVSPIVVGLALVLVAVAIRPKGEPAPYHLLWVPLALVLVCAAGFAFATGTPYATEKALQMATLVPLSLWGGMVLLQSAKAREWWLAGTVTYAALIAILISFSPDALAADVGRLSIEGANTIAVGRAPGAAVVVLLTLALAGDRRRGLLLLAGGVFAVLMLTTGSRGPLAAAVFSVAVTAPLIRSRHKFLWAVVAVIGAFYSWRAAGASGYLSDRLLTLEDNSRRTLYSQAWAATTANPIGLGWGGLEQVHSVGLQSHTYTHNLFLETAGEAGWIALAALLVLLFVALRRQARQVNTSPVEAAMFALALFFIASALVSGDLPSQRGMWAMLGACMVAGWSPGPRRRGSRLSLHRGPASPARPSSVDRVGQ